MKFAQSSAVYFNYSLQYAIKDLYSSGYDGIEIWGGRPHMYRNDLDEQLDEIKDLLNLILTIEDCFKMLDELKSDKFGILMDTDYSGRCMKGKSARLPLDFLYPGSEITQHQLQDRFILLHFRAG